MSWGTVLIGRMTLRETFTASDATDGSTGARAVSLTGEESSPPLTLAELAQRREDLAGLNGRLVPVRFSTKSDLDGWYTVTDAGAEITNWSSEVAKFSWSLKLSRAGAANAIDLESRLTGAGRQNAYGQAGERWHAPSASATGYFTGTSQPFGSIDRALATEGTITVFRGVPSGVSPRWSSTLADYGRGRSRVLVDGVERTAQDVVVGASAWSMSNDLIRVSPGASATLQVEAWDGSAWDRIDWNASVSGSTSGAITTWRAASVLRNDYELTTVRLMSGTTAAGRVTLDLSLRRGSRFVETYLQSDVAATPSWYRSAAEAGTASASTAYVSATGNDAGGNRYVIISAGPFTANTAQGGLTRAAARTLDAGIGSVVGGGSAVAGNTAASLRDQYILALAERTAAVIR